MTYSQQNSSIKINGQLRYLINTDFITNDDISEIKISLFTFELFGSKIQIILENSYQTIIRDFFLNLNNEVEYEIAKKQLIIDYFKMVIQNITDEKALEIYQKYPNICRVHIIIKDQEELIISIVLQNKRDKKINNLLD